MDPNEASSKIEINLKYLYSPFLEFPKIYFNPHWLIVGPPWLNSLYGFTQLLLPVTVSRVNLEGYLVASRLTRS